MPFSKLTIKVVFGKKKAPLRNATVVKSKRESVERQNAGGQKINSMFIMTSIKGVLAFIT